MFVTLGSKTFRETNAEDTALIKTDSTEILRQHWQVADRVPLNPLAALHPDQVAMTADNNEVFMKGS